MTEAETRKSATGETQASADQRGQFEDVAARLAGVDDPRQAERIAAGALVDGDAILAVLASVRARGLDPASQPSRDAVRTLCEHAAMRASAIDALLAWCDGGRDDAVAEFVLGELLRNDGQLHEARARYERAAQLDPELQEAADNYIAVTQATVGDFTKAQEHWLREIETSGPSLDRCNNLGVAYAFLGRFRAAEHEFRRAIGFSPQSWEQHQNLFWVLMLQNRLREAWKEHDWREIVADKALLENDVPAWNGGDLAGKTLLVLAEQGLGDEIMFASCFVDLLAAGVRCIFQCNARLATLLHRSFPAATILPSRDLESLDGWSIPAPDCKVLAGTLPHVVRPTLGSFPAHDGFLRADPERVAHWRERLAALGARKVIGISWRGGTRPRDRFIRSIPLREWAFVAQRRDVAVVSLQYGEHAEEIREAEEALGARIHTFPDLDCFNDIEGLAALVRAVDLVVSVDNSTVHLAGALGVPVWTLLPFVTDWRWFTGLHTSPWYPSMRLFRQPAPGDWESVKALVSSALDEMGERPAAPSRDPVAEALAAGRDLHARGRLSQAEAVYRGIIERHPHNAEARHLLGLLALQLGHPGPATEHIRRAIEIAPGKAEFFVDMSRAWEARGQLDEALRMQDQAATLEPGNVEYVTRFAELLRMAGRFGDAVRVYTHLDGRDLLDNGARNNLGVTLYELRRFPEAIVQFEKILERDPEAPGVWSNLGLARQNAGNVPGAREAYERAVEISPDDAVAHYNLGLLYHDVGQLDGAAREYRRAVEINPDLVQAWNNLGNALLNSAAFDEALEAYERAAALDDGRMRTGENLLYAVNYSVRHSAQEIFDLHRAWGVRNQPGARRPAARARGEGDPLRIGFVSPDFRRHSVAYFLLPLFEHLDRARFELYAYSCSSAEDDVTARIRGLVPNWLQVDAVDDDTLRGIVARDGIDVLVDCAGHTRGNRLAVFARRAAPLQLTYVGYPNTTGLTAIDFRIADATADPEGHERFYTERLWRLPGCHLCYAAPPEAAEPALEAARDGKGVVFGSFNDLAKLNGPVIEAWVRILSAVPGAHLFLRSKYLAGDVTCDAIRKRFADAGLAPDRITLRPWAPGKVSHLAEYGKVDVALDPFPYNGVTTTFEALYMGVPVVTLAGERHAGRMGASILDQLPAGGAVCDSVEEYVAAACKLGAKGQRSTASRKKLRAALLGSPLTDQESFARGFADALTEMWRQTMQEKAT